MTSTRTWAGWVSLLVLTTACGGDPEERAREASDSGAGGTGSTTGGSAGAAGSASAGGSAGAAPGECTGDASAKLVHFDDFDDEALHEDRWNAKNCIWDAHSSLDTCPKPSTLRARSGSRSLRTALTYHDGTTGVDSWYHKKDNPSDDHTHRSELSIKSWSGFDPSQLKLGDEQWYGFSMYLPGKGDANADPALSLSVRHSYLIPWQLHDVPDPGEISRNPPLAFSLYGVPKEPLPAFPDTEGKAPGAQTSPPSIPPTHWLWWTLNDSQAIQTDREYDGSHHFYAGKWANELGTWVDWVVRYKPNHTSEGILEIWRNGTKVASYFGPNSFNDQAAPYLKIGQYSGRLTLGTPVPADWPEQTVVYLDSHKLALAPANPSTPADTDNCAYRLVAPQGTPH
ncbi:MAG: heparin lyase I family protein [Polyangiaceae bacterium]